MIFKPSEFFEQKKIQEQLQQQVDEPEEEIKVSRLKSPSALFDPKPIEETVEEIEEEIIEEGEVDPIEEIKSLVEEVRSQIPDIPEIKTYDGELNSLREELDRIYNTIQKQPEPKYYDEDVKELHQKIDSIEIPEVPEVRYYEDDIQELHQKIDSIEIPEVRYYDEDIQNLHQKVDGIKIPEVKYYDAEIYNLGEEIAQVESRVSKIPEVKYYDEDVKELHQKIDSIEIPEVKYYDEDVKELHQKIDSIEIPEVRYYENDIQELHQKIDDIKIPEVKYYDEDVKELHQKIDDIKIPEVPEVRYYEDDIQELHQKIDSIEIPEVPEVKYYDKDIDDLKTSIGVVKSKIKEPKFYDEDIKELRKIIREIKEKQETLMLSEGLTNEPQETNTKDPLTPLNQNFATLDDLQNHYKLFINRIQQQLSTLGGGGETRLEFLDDVDRTTAKTDGYVLQYQASTGKWIGVAGGGGSGTANITVSSTPPTGVTEGHLWWSNDEGQLYIYYDDQWVQAAESVLAQEDIPTDVSDLTDTTNLLFSGNYNDLTNKPVGLATTGYVDAAVVGLATTGYVDAAVAVGIVNDSTPQLGGNLDLNTHNLTGTGSILTTGDIQITGNVSAGGNVISSQLAPSNGDLVLRSSYGGSASGARITLDGDNLNANITLDPFGSGIVDVQSALTATGDVTGYAFNGRIGSITGTSVNQVFYPVFVSSIQPDQYLEANSGLMYNPSTGILTATRFSGGFSGTLASDLNAQSFAKIINLPTPTNAGDAASKNYVDNQIAGITGFATESYVNTYVNARTQDLADNRGVWVRNADYTVNTGDFNRVIPFDVELVTSTIPNFSHSAGVFQNTDSRTRRFLFQMQVAIKATSGQYSEADIWFSYNATYSGSNRRGQVNFVNDDSGVYNCMLTSSWTFTLAQNETVRCYVWAQTPYKVGGSAFGNDRSCLVEVQELN